MEMELGVTNHPHGSAPSHEQVRWFQEIGRRLDRRGYIAANDGNLSERQDDGSILITATGSRKGYLEPDEVVRVGLGGELLHGKRGASSELDMHLSVYQVRPDVRAIVHAHPPTATAFAVARQPMDECVLPEVILTLGSVPIAPYGTPGTRELAESIEGAIREHDAVLLANHGAITVGSSLEDAYFVMERVEHSARILFTARLLGNVELLPRGEIERLMQTGPPETRNRIPCVPGTDEDTQQHEHQAANKDERAQADPPDLIGLITEVLKARGMSNREKE